MAGLGTYVLTLADWAKRLDPDGKVPQIVELLGQTNEILTDMMFKEGNLPIGERVTIRTGLPTVYWRLLNQAVSVSKSTTAQVDESCGMLEAYSTVDRKLAELNGNINSFRLSEAQAFIEAMNQEMASTLFYGNSSSDPEEFNGLSVRYSSLSADNAQNIINAGGAGSDNMSIWLIVWGENGCYGIFPKGSKAGLQHEDLGLETVTGSTGVAGTLMRAYRDHWVWETGLVVKDWRQVVRICNIDVSNLTTESSAADLTKLMTKAVHRIHALNMGRPVFYMNRTAIQMLDIQRQAEVKAGGGITWQTIDGKVIPFFRQIPIRLCDALLENETAVS